MDTEETCWTMLQGVAAGEREARERFGERYLPVVRSYLRARWRGSRDPSDVDDATQEVFMEFLRSGGPLQRALQSARQGFGAYLFGVTCNVARRFESGQRGVRGGADRAVALEALDFIGSDEPASEIFQRGWAQALIEEAGSRMREAARAQDERARRRVELLELKFTEELPIREIAKRWGVEAAGLHREYSKAKDEFRSTLREVIRLHHPSASVDVEKELEQILVG